STDPSGLHSGRRLGLRTFSCGAQGVHADRIGLEALRILFSRTIDNVAKKVTCLRRPRKAITCQDPFNARVDCFEFRVAVAHRSSSNPSFISWTFPTTSPLRPTGVTVTILRHPTFVVQATRKPA